MLQQDMEHLDEIQSTTASAREFALIYRANNSGAPARAQRSGSRGERSRSEMSELSPSGVSEGYGACGDAKQLEKRIRDCGFHVRMAEEQDVQRLLAVYYRQDVTTERFERFDGERSVAQDG